MATLETNERLDEAREAVVKLFAIMGISRVVVVDDKYTASPKVEDILGTCMGLINEGKAQVIQKIEQFSELSLEEDDQEVLRQFFATRLKGLDEPDRKSVAVILADLADGKDDHENATRTGLEELLVGQEVLQFPLDKWLEEKAQLLSEESTSQTLFLFDQDMSAGGGGENQGMEIIRELLQDKEVPPIYCGLFSHTIPANHEHDAWNELSQQHGLGNEKHRFAVLAKEHLSNDPWAFACRLKRVAITSRCDDLKSMVTEVLDSAHSDAKQKLSELSIYDFEQIVFQSSYAEGVWEADTVIRLFGLFQRHSAREFAKNHPQIPEVTRDVRQVVRYPYKPDDAPKSTSIEIRRLELYESAEFLNEHHSPIELGDVFQKTQGKRRFVVIAQPCELMVRSTGKRTNVDHVVLSEIFTKRPSDRDAFFELPLFESANHTSCWVRLHGSTTVPVQILDLAVFRADGICKVKIGEDIPKGLIPSWEHRFSMLQTVFEKMIMQFDNLFGETKGKLEEVQTIAESAILKSVKGIAKGKLAQQRKEISYDVKRVGRIKEPLASSLLRSYSSHMSRDAFEHDITKGVVLQIDET